MKLPRAGLVPLLGPLLLRLAAVPSIVVAQPLSAKFCQEFQLTVDIEAENFDTTIAEGIYSEPASLLISTTLPSLLARLADAKINVHGIETFRGTYCEPDSCREDRLGTLQLLVHGITYTRDYWSASPAEYQPETYSWVEQALQRGYPTLAIDRIGNGDSSHPDPYVKLQIPYETRATHALIEYLRNGAAAQLPRNFDKIIYVGHSFGSEIGSNVANQFPADMDAAILTGFSRQVLPAVIGLALLIPFPAAVFDPERFGALPLGYLVTSSKSNRRRSFYYKPGFAYDPELYEIDWETQGTVGIAELLSAAISTTAAPAYVGKVFVLTGDRDAVFCGKGNSLLGLGLARCGDGPGSILDRTGELFPAAAAYEYYSIPDTGHCLNFHYTAPESIARAHDWLDREGF